MTDKAKGGWACATIYLLACLFGVWGWIGLVIAIICGCIGLVVKVASQEYDKPLVEAPTKTCDVAAGQRCPLCHADFEIQEVAETCAGCGTLYHQGCREEWGVCATLGCRKRKRTLRSQGDLFLVGKSTTPRPRVRARPMVRRKISLRRDPGSGALEVGQSASSPQAPLAAEPSSERLAQAAQRILHRGVAS
tara:strand:+ start:712 stop:1287 length:576 start_codon:yes stop_codon:yes gene_type:complete